ncbi:MAG: hypothetical protein ABI315_04500 [Bacteroidia bacterium]
MKLIFILICSLNTLCGQVVINCNIPIGISVDSLNNYLMSDYLKRTYQKNISKSSIEFRTEFDLAKSKTKNFDSIYLSCENYLIKKLGKDIYCKYIDMQGGCCSIEKFPTEGFMIRYGLQLPNLVNKLNYGWAHYNYERIDVDFKIVTNADSTLQITYPANVPDCNGLPDCGFKITKEKAIKILIKKKIIKKDTKYSVKVDGINWVVGFVDSECIKSIKINLQTGKLSPIEKYYLQ